MIGRREEKYENHRYNATKKENTEMKVNRSAKYIKIENKYALLGRGSNNQRT